jgi:hypothetical protein
VRTYLKELDLLDVRVDEFQEGLNPEQARRIVLAQEQEQAPRE